MMNEYYDINTNRIFLGGKNLKCVQDKSTEYVVKKLIYPSVLPMYFIGQSGIIINPTSDIIVKPVFTDGFPWVTLSAERFDHEKRVFYRCRFKIVDLVAYNFIRNSERYLERGFIAVNKNGLTEDNHYMNVMYNR